MTTEIKPKHGTALFGVALASQKGGETFFPSRIQAEQLASKAQPFNKEPLCVVEAIWFTPSQFAQEVEEQREEAAREAFKHALDYAYEGEPDDTEYENYVRIGLEEFADYWQSQKQKKEGK